MHSSRLAPQARPHALADLDVAIAKAEADLGRHQRNAARLGGEEARRAKIYLRIVEERVAQLQRSREVLIGGEHGRGDEEEAEVS